MKMWTSFDVEFIETQLKKLEEDVTTIEMWQNLDDLREKFSGFVSSCTSVTTKVTLDAKYKSAYSKVNVQQPIYFHYSKIDMLFKKDIYTIEDANVISFKTPSEIKFRDKRITDRFYYKYQDFKNISYTLETSEVIYSSILTDIATAGLSFVLSLKEKNKLSPGSIIKIRGLTDQIFEEELEARVVYVSPFKIDRESRSDLLQVGVQFTAALDSISYKSVSKIVRIKQEKIRGLDTDKFNGLHPDEFNRLLTSISQTNKQLALNIREASENIDRLRYLTTEMKRNFLMEVNHDLLATAMRMSSKELVFDLLSEVTTGIKDEFLEKLNVPKPASAINKAQDIICKFIGDKEKSGDIILDPRSFIKYV